MASLIYNSFWDDLAKGNINPDADTFRVSLHTASYTENKDTHEKFSDVTNELATGSGYTAGGAVTDVTVTKDTANDRLNIEFDTVDWPESTITARKAVIRKARGGAASADELVCVIDFGSDVSTSDQTFRFSASTVRIQN